MSNNAIPGWTGGEFAVNFLFMGQGDCCVAKLPNGDVMLIDGGSASDFDEAQDLPRIHNILNVFAPNDVINYMVLTHPDRDHYDKLVKIMGDRTVETVFISCGIIEGKTSCTGSYRINNVSNHLISTKWGTETIVDVNVNTTGFYINAWSEKDQFKEPIVFSDEEEVKVLPKFLCDQLVAGTGRLKTKYLTVASDTHWKVTIVAANVGLGNHDRSTEVPDALRNGASLVTRMWIDNGEQETLIVHGDADIETMKFLNTSNTQNNLGLADTNIIQAPHHGSPTGFLASYMQLLNPQAVVISVGLGEYKHCLPKQTVIDNYQMILYDNDTGRGQFMDDHDLVGWVTFPSANDVWAIIQGWLNAKYWVQFRNASGGETRRANQSDVTNTLLGKYTIITNDFNSLPNNSYYVAIPGQASALLKREYRNSIQETGLPVSKRGPVNFNLDGL